MGPRVAAGAFHLLRVAERVLPQSLLRWLLWPVAALWAAAEASKHRRACAAHRFFPRAWRPDRNRFLVQQTLGLYHARLVYLWPDRLTEPRWLSRCRLHAPFALASLQKNERPIIFVSLHFGPFETLVYWLRAYGIPVTVLVGRPAPNQQLKQRQYSLSPPATIPLAVPVTEMRRIRALVQPGRALLVMLDVARGRQLQIPFDGHSWRIATGAIRLAASTGAELIPCLITGDNRWLFDIHFGKPTPRNCLEQTPDFEQAGAHFLHEALPIITRYPSQCGQRLLSCISPTPTKLFPKSDDQNAAPSSPCD